MCNSSCGRPPQPKLQEQVMADTAGATCECKHNLWLMKLLSAGKHGPEPSSLLTTRSTKTHFQQLADCITRQPILVPYGCELQASAAGICPLNRGNITHLSLKALQKKPLLVLLLFHRVELMTLNHCWPGLALQAHIKGQSHSRNTTYSQQLE